MAHDGHRLAETDIAAVQARVDADPRVQGILRDPKLYPRDKMLHLNTVIKELGLPESYYVDTDGRVRFNDGTDWKKWAVPAIGVGTLGAGALGAFGSGVQGALGGGTAAKAGAGTTAGSYIWDEVKDTAKDSLTGGGDGSAPWWLKAAMTAMAGGAALQQGRQGPSAEENALNAQAQRILGQQEARTQYANPLYEATMQMAYGLLPQRPGDYPGGK